MAPHIQAVPHRLMLFRLAAATALLCTSAIAQLGPMYSPAENPQTPEKVLLGKFLFWEEQLSSDNSVACGTCHLPEFGGGDGHQDLAIHPGVDGIYGTPDDVRGSHGIVLQDNNSQFAASPVFALSRQVTGRTSPSNLGAGHHAALFWDTRASNTFTDPETGTVMVAINGQLESQAIGPIMNPAEMGKVGRTWQDVRSKLQQAKPLKLASNLTADLHAAQQQFGSYPSLFQNAFGDPAINAARIAFALASYQRTLNPDQTPWDEYMAGNPNALNAYQLQGWDLFQNQARCISCHWEPLFSDDLPHNLGLRPNAEDVGAFAVTGFAYDVGGFKTPTLRNSGLRPRLFHNGQSVALDDPAQVTDPTSVLNIYLQGGGVDLSNLDPFMIALGTHGVTAQDLVVVQDFVITALTDPRAANRQPPFDHPDLRSMTVPPPRVFGFARAGNDEPFFIDTDPTFIGNSSYRLGVAGGDGAGIALLTYGFASFEPGLDLAGLPWNVNALGWIPMALQGPTGAPGYATLQLPIPDAPVLSQLAIYWQLFVDDPLAPNSTAASKGWQLVIQ